MPFQKFSKKWYVIKVPSKNVGSTTDGYSGNLHVDTLTWLHRNCGQSTRFTDGVWTYRYNYEKGERDHDNMLFAFKDKTHAMLFKLAWVY